MKILALLLALAAPDPEPPATPSPVGEWTLEWSGGEGPCQLAKDGSFACLWAGTPWIGLWELKDGTLSVSEWIPARDEWTPASQHIRWSARLEPGTLQGKLDLGGGNFRLRKRAAP